MDATLLCLIRTSFNSLKMGLSLLALFFCQLLFAPVTYGGEGGEPFVAEHIKINGLQRLPARVVFKSLTIDVGDTVTQSRVAQSLKSLFASGNFDDAKLSRIGSTLVVTVAERPSISKIELNGNKVIESEQLLEGLKQSGLEKGSVFRRAMLDRVRLELERQYVAQGRYGARVETEVKPQPRNRVAIHININEGKVAAIKHINVVGNRIYSTETLLDLFKLKSTGMFSFFRMNDKYSRERLAADLEVLRSWYTDRGYINFTIDSTQVSITPDKQNVFITINITEGAKYLIGQVDLSGELPIPESTLLPLIVIKQGQVFSSQLLTLTEELMTKKLGNVGYTFARVKAVPKLEPNENVVNLTFYIDPGNRTYVRRIEFSGNERTSDEVLRREMRQMESSWASTEKIERSKQRLQRLGFFKGVSVKTEQIPGVDDQVDVKFTVEEQPSGSIGASVGYQAGTGLVFGAQVSDSNFLGTGNRVTFDIRRTDIRNRYRFDYTNPYYTVDGVSRGFKIYFTETDYSEIEDFSSYRTDAYGTGLNFGYPINEHERLNFGFGFDNTTIFANQFSAEDVRNFIGYVDSCGGVPGCDSDTQDEAFNTYFGTISWRRNTLNKGTFPDRGSQNSVGLELSLPGSDLSYYKLSYNGERYFALPKSWALRTRAELGYGGGYSDTERLPFYKHFLAGGFGSIRGFESRSLGPKEAVSGGPVSDDPFGGNVLVETSLEFIFPAPFVKDKRSVRTFLFVDGGNVFDTEREDAQNVELDIAEFRYSAGVSLSWLTGIGPLTFTFARALNDKPGDEAQFFDFSLGQFF